MAPEGLHFIAVKPAVQLLQIQEVHLVPHSNACNVGCFLSFSFSTCPIWPSFTSGTPNKLVCSFSDSPPDRLTSILMLWFLFHAHNTSWGFALECFHYHRRCPPISQVVVILSAHVPWYSAHILYGSLAFTTYVLIWKYYYMHSSYDWWILVSCASYQSTQVTHPLC